MDNFPEHCGDVGDEQGERLHQYIKVMEERHQGRWDKRMVADYCWSLKRDKPYQHHLRKSKKRRFFEKSTCVILHVVHLIH